jgi:long-chain acyl-CoA synthetase
VISASTETAFRFGSVGKPIPGVELAIAEDGEVLTRGRHVMKGYYRMPDASEEAIGPEGWFRTGDIGELDGEGFLYVTDRKKELIKTSGGKFVAPQPIEARATESRFVSQAMVVGERRKFPALLVVPNFEALEGWAEGQGIPTDDRGVLVRDPAVVSFYEREALDRLEDLARFERPKKVALLPRELTVEGGELTPTLKIKRRVVRERYSALIESLYSEE